MPELRPGSSRCLCSTCGCFFTGTTGFDKHRIGKHEPYERRCMTAAEMQAAGLVERDGIWGKPGMADGHWAKAEPVADEA